MNQPDEIERIIGEFAEGLYQALKAAFETTRGEIDVQQLAEAFASGDDQAIEDALGIASESLRQNIDQGTAGLFAEAFTGAAIMAATILGYPAHKLGTIALVVRDNLRFTLAAELAKIDVPGFKGTASLLLATGEKPQIIADYIARNIGLSEPQRKSLDKFRNVLTKAQQTGTTKLSVRELRSLNASQRSILSKALRQGVDDETVRELTRRQLKQMQAHRLFTTADTLGRKLVQLGQQAMWEQLERNGLINGYRRYWVHAGDERVRTTHRAIPADNKGGRGLQEPFQTPLGPAHTPPLEINCRCRVELRKPTQ